MNTYTNCIRTLLAMLLLTGITFAQTPNYSLGQKGGSTGKDIGHSIAVDPEGNYYVALEYHGPATFGGLTLNTVFTPGTANMDYAVVKYDSNGTALWALAGGGSVTDRGYGVALDNAGKVYVCGELFGTAIFDGDTLISTGNLDGFLFKIDPSGSYIWKKQMKSVSQLATRGIAVDANNNIYVAGYFGSSSALTANFDGTVITSYGNRDIFLAKYTSEGTLIWVKNFGGSNSSEEGRSVVVDAEGNAYLTGTITGTANFGDIVVTGNAGTATDMFVAKISPEGTVLWAKSGGGPAVTNGDDGNGIALDQLGNVYVTGKMDSAGVVFDTTTLNSVGGLDAYVVKYDNSGNLLWASNGGSTTNDYGYEIICDSYGNATLFGTFTGTAFFGTDTVVSAGGEDIFILQIDPSGDIIFVKHTSGSGVDKVFGADKDWGDNFYLTGSFFGNLVLDGFTLTTYGVEDVFSARLGNNPVPVELVSFNAAVNGTSVVLNWETATEVNNSGFSIERSSDNKNFSSVGFVKGNGTTTEKKKYSYTDSKLNAAVYYYRLKQMDLDGQFDYSNTVEVNLEIPSAFSLSQNYPNPFNPSTEVSFSLPVDASLTFTVFNAVGEKVQETSKNFTAGTYTQVVDGSSLSSGIYFYTINAVGNNGSVFNATKKMVLIK